MVALDLAVRTLTTAHYNNMHIVLRSDNSGCIGALSSGRSLNLASNFVLRNIMSNFQLNNLWITVNWIPTAENLADGPSCGIFPS